MSSRLCFLLNNVEKNYETESKSKHLHECFVCSEKTYSRFCICNVSLNYLTWKGSNNNKKYFFDYHQDIYFGLCKYYMSLVGKGSRNCKSPTIAEVDKNKRFIKCLKAHEKEEEDSNY